MSPGTMPWIMCFGYSIGNDISQRDWQRDDRTMFRGKNCDTFKPFGPWIVTGLDPAGSASSSAITARYGRTSSSADQIWDTATWIQETEPVHHPASGRRALDGHPGGGRRYGSGRRHRSRDQWHRCAQKLRRGRGLWSLQPSLAQDVEFLRESCRVLVGLYRGVAFQGERRIPPQDLCGCHPRVSLTA